MHNRNRIENVFGNVKRERGDHFNTRKRILQEYMQFLFSYYST